MPRLLQGTLDDLLASGARRVTLIKIDVQGAEARVLTGAERVLQRDHPALFVEIDPAALVRFGSDVESLLALLFCFDYAPHALERDGFYPLNPAMPNDLLARRGYVDVLLLASRQP